MIATKITNIVAICFSRASTGNSVIKYKITPITKSPITSPISDILSRLRLPSRYTLRATQLEIVAYTRIGTYEMTAMVKPDWTPDLPYVPHATGKYMITPEMALHWLNRLVNCRIVNPADVEAYARDMVAGNWNENGETIKWDVEDNCVDGETRLRACVLAGVPFESWVVVGLPVRAARTVDLGRKRLLSAVLRNSGERYSTQLASTATLVWRWEGGRDRLIEKRTKPTYSELAKLIEDNAQIRTSVELIYGSCGRASRLSRSSTVPSVIHYYGSRNHADRADTFVRQIHTGTDIGPGDPAYALREKLIKLGQKQNRFTQRETLGIWIPAWNAFAEGRTLKRIDPVDFNDPEQLIIL